MAGIIETYGAWILFGGLMFFMMRRGGCCGGQGNHGGQGRPEADGDPTNNDSKQDAKGSSLYADHTSNVAKKNTKRGCCH